MHVSLHALTRGIYCIYKMLQVKINSIQLKEKDYCCHIKLKRRVNKPQLTISTKWWEGATPLAENLRSSRLLPHRQEISCSCTRAAATVQPHLSYVLCNRHLTCVIGRIKSSDSSDNQGWEVLQARSPWQTTSHWIPCAALCQMLMYLDKKFQSCV